MTTEQFFKDLAAQVNLGLNDEERKLIEKKQNELREKLRLDQGIKLEDDFLAGSYARDTIIKPKSAGEEFDVDVFIAFSDEEYGEKDLEELRETTVAALKVIKRNYPGLGITKIDEEQKRSIGVEYGGNFQIDVVPSIQIERDKKYKVFDTQSLEAVQSNPKLHGQRLTDANERTESGSLRRLVPIIKILKGWKREKCNYLKSFHLEVLIVEILGSKKIESFSEGIARFFANAEGYLRKAGLKDPANPGNILDEYLDKDGTRNQLLSVVASDNGVAEKARRYELAGEEDKAIREWKRILESGASGGVASGPIIITGRPAKPHSW